MSFVGTRPEVVKYVKKYKPEYFARDAEYAAFMSSIIMSDVEKKNG